MHHIEIIGRYINLAMSSPEKPQDRSVLVILTHRVLRHFAVSNHEFQEKNNHGRKVENTHRRLQKTGSQTIKMTLRYALSKSFNRVIFSTTSIGILPTKCNITPASPTDVEFRV